MNFFQEFNARRLTAIDVNPNQGGSVSIQQNYLLGESTNQIMVNASSSQSCNFSNNECIGGITETAANVSLLVQLQADHINASNNRLVGNGENAVMRLNSNRIVAVGNMSTGNILTAAGGGLPAPWDALNIFI